MLEEALSVNFKITDDFFLTKIEVKKIEEIGYHLPKSAKRLIATHKILKIKKFILD